MSNTPAEQLLANAIRVLSMDAVEKAKSGHPGMPMGMAEIAVALWTRHYQHHPKNPAWPNRDRFVVSNGHGSMLHYSLLHFAGYDLPMSEIEHFRQLHSKTPGHPEVGITPGIETTTGPLGQGIANAVGMALAEWLLASEFNRPGHQIVDHFTYALLGDGCLMEGISHEVCSLAGTLGLSKLIFLYDDNGISIDGEVKHWFADNTPKRFESYGWNVLSVDGHDVAAVDAAIASAKAQAKVAGGKPTLICCKTIIGKGSPNKQGTDGVHGAALGAAEVAATRAALGWNHAPFQIPAEVYAGFAQTGSNEAVWNSTFADYQKSFPQEAAEFTRRMKGELPAAYIAQKASLIAKAQAANATVASRKASQAALNELATLLPELLGGSADLTGSNFTDWKGVKALRAGSPGAHINYGVREFGMAAIMNGVALHGGYLPYGGTFLTFSDYSRNAIRMAALMKKRVVHVFTHDSIGLGEDGPTHQSVEHVASLRLIPNLKVWRPADNTETMAAWCAAIDSHDGPSALILSRQNLPALARSEAQVAAIAHGAYVLAEDSEARITLIATGSEVELAQKAHTALASQGIKARLVSMPCCEVFNAQSQDYQHAVLGKAPRLAIEAGVSASLARYAQAVVGIDTFGESAPAPALFQHFGFTVDNVIATAKQLLA